MTLVKWRTTKIPEYYFHKIEETIDASSKYVSVSEFIRSAIEEKLSKSTADFLLLKDLVFNETRIKQIHEIISTKSKMDSKGLLKNDIQMVIDNSLDLELVSFLAKFFYNFAKYHPFKDGNKRTLLVVVDVFLRLNNLKLKLNTKKDTETKDEVFFWQNSSQQKNIEQIKIFINEHLENHESSAILEKEIKQCTNENKLLLEKLSR